MQAKSNNPMQAEEHHVDERVAVMQSLFENTPFEKAAFAILLTTRTNGREVIPPQVCEEAYTAIMELHKCLMHYNVAARLTTIRD